MDSWLLQQQGRESFVSIEELRRLAQSGRVDPGDLVYHPTRARWLYARDIEELAGQFGTARGALVPVTSAPSTALAPAPASGALATAHNDAAVAGFTLGVLGIIPVLGVACALVGLPLSLRGMRRANELGGSDRRFAVAGFVLTLSSLLINGGLTLLALL